MVAVGKFVLYDGFVPPLEAGDYDLVARHTLSSPDVSGLNVETQSSRVRITSPRFKLPPDQILSTFPPANSEGAYESRLPQIVIKRRTMPWERRPLRPGDPEVPHAPEEAADRNTPWLALVVIAEGEGEISVETPIADCVTPGVPMNGPSDVVKGLYLAVPQSVVRKVFPTVEDLRLLAHVREVSLADTENALGDDDGFMAVVLANRLPQFDRVACKPVRYMACLLNLEGQLDALPAPTPPINTFLATEFVFNAAAVVQNQPVDPDLRYMGAEVDSVFTPQFTGGNVPRSGPGTRAVLGGTTAQINVSNPTRATATQSSRAGEWASDSVTARISDVATSANSDDAAFVVRDAMKAGFRIPFEAYVLEKTYRFPVLAHWSFTCNGAGSLDTIMQELDVGLLGTLPGPDAEPPRPECLPPVVGDAPPPADKPRVAPEVTGTGHVGLAHKTREGEDRRAWFRGPFVPFATRRRHQEGDLPVLAHVSDQLRLTIPDGREDLSLAVAFEIGRLLALSQPSFVAALMRWRREQFGAERARLLNGKLSKVGQFAGTLDLTLGQGVAREVGRRFLKVASADLVANFGDARPIADPGRPIEHLAANPITDLANGLGIDRQVLVEAQQLRDPAMLDRVSVARGASADTLDPAIMQALDAGLDESLRSVLDQGGAQPVRDLRRSVAEDEDALDALIRRTTERRKKELD
ncbi:hypothetical protein [Aliiroseovarius sp. F47248L]|uniref:hypothetical protein n=1 Tax=Aliiroseovarius sp. F47248L TaxID=2926420 RepID=UPI001FF2FC13|nr:hypothetical protein [Aliiroseovarius sp. F47248L]MCK0140756.1 hypothetical protein [Aliiroseovarius sp. F47248L]